MINSIPSNNPGSGASVMSSQGAKFGDNPFLSLLVEQMRSQTPLEPMDNSSFMQQLASYSTMTEQKELNNNMLKLLDYQGVLARLQGISESSALLGKEVSFMVGNTESSGVVDSVFVNEEGEVRMNVGDAEIGLRDVLGIRLKKAE